MNKTNIEYLDYSWNPLAMRCTPVSEGCANCWHIKRADMLNSNPKISHNIRLAYGGNAPPVLVPERLDDPLKRKQPAVIGIQFMGDLFHNTVPNITIDLIWERMRKCPQHTFLILTKRPERLLVDYDGSDPLSNIWLGVTAENQQRADERLPILLQIPAAKRFVSIEPMFGPVNLKKYLPCPECGGQGWTYCEGEYGESEKSCCVTCADYFDKLPQPPNYLDWVIVGGESGPGARPMHPDWVRSVRDHCIEAGVPFFFKQWGEYVPDTQYWQGRGILNPSVPNSKIVSGEEPIFSLKKPGFNYLRVGKKQAGCFLDDKIWNERP